MAASAVASGFSLSDTYLPSGFPANIHLSKSTLRLTFTITWSGLTLSLKPYLDMSFHVYNADKSVLKSVNLSSYFTATSGTGTFTIDLPLSQVAGITSGNTYTAAYSGVIWNNNGLSELSVIYTTTVQTFTYYAYDVPTIPTFTVQRCTSAGVFSDDGAYVKATASFIVSSVGSNNTKTLKIYRKLKSDSTWTLDTTASISSLGYSATWGAAVLALTYATAFAYDLKAELADRINTVTNVKEVLYNKVTMDVDVANKQVAIGKSVVSGGPGLDVGANAIFRDAVNYEKAPEFQAGGLFDAAPGFASASVITALLGKIMPCCVLSNPIVSEDIVYNSTLRQYLMRFQTITRNGTFNIRKGATGGVYDIGVTIPADGFYYVCFNVHLSKSSSNSNANFRFHNLPSTWAANVDRNYMLAADWSSEIQGVTIGCVSYSSTNTFGLVCGILYCTAGSFVIPSVEMQSATKTLENTHTRFAIVKIG